LKNRGRGVCKVKEPEAHQSWLRERKENHQNMVMLQLPVAKVEKLLALPLQ
jgi:hypothetical protein